MAPLETQEEASERYQEDLAGSKQARVTENDATAPGTSSPVTITNTSLEVAPPFAVDASGFEEEHPAQVVVGEWSKPLSEASALYEQGRCHPPAIKKGQRVGVRPCKGKRIRINKIIERFKGEVDEYMASGRPVTGIIDYLSSLELPSMIDSDGVKMVFFTKLGAHVEETYGVRLSWGSMDGAMEAIGRNLMAPLETQEEASERDQEDLAGSKQACSTWDHATAPCTSSPATITNTSLEVAPPFAVDASGFEEGHPALVVLGDCSKLLSEASALDESTEMIGCRWGDSCRFCYSRHGMETGEKRPCKAKRMRINKIIERFKGEVDEYMASGRPVTGIIDYLSSFELPSMIDADGVKRMFFLKLWVHLEKTHGVRLVESF